MKVQNVEELQKMLHKETKNINLRKEGDNMNVNNSRGELEFSIRREGGITLIALIITIIILVILAAVSINAAYNSGIINYAVNGTQNYIEAAKKEEEYVQNANNVMQSVMNRVEEIQTIDLIGKYVDYTPADNNAEYSKITGNSTYTGNTNNVANFVREDFNWRIWSIKGNKLTLIADGVTKQGGYTTSGGTSGRLYLTGAVGYNNAVQILNDICKTCYSNGDWAIGRSINIKDIEDVMNKSVWNPSSFIADNTSAQTYTSGYKFETNKQYPYIHQFEEYSNIDGTVPTNGVSGSKQPTENSDGYYPSNSNNTQTATSYIEPIQTYWKGQNLTAKNFKYNVYYELLFKNNNGNTNIKNYWLASRCIATHEEIRALFRIYYVRGTNGEIWGYDLFGSSGGSNQINYAVRPMVEIDLTVKTLDSTTNSGNDTEHAFTLE